RVVGGAGVAGLADIVEVPASIAPLDRSEPRQRATHCSFAGRSAAILLEKERLPLGAAAADGRQVDRWLIGSFGGRHCRVGCRGHRQRGGWRQRPVRRLLGRRRWFFCGGRWWLFQLLADLFGRSVERDLFDFDW